MEPEIKNRITEKKVLMLVVFISSNVALFNNK